MSHRVVQAASRAPCWYQQMGRGIHTRGNDLKWCDFCTYTEDGAVACTVPVCHLLYVAAH